jgi:hypothetical protein
MRYLPIFFLPSGLLVNSPAFRDHYSPPSSYIRTTYGRKTSHFPPLPSSLRILGNHGYGATIINDHGSRRCRYGTARLPASSNRTMDEHLSLYRLRSSVVFLPCRPKGVQYWCRICSANPIHPAPDGRYYQPIANGILARLR